MKLVSQLVLLTLLAIAVHSSASAADPKVVPAKATDDGPATELAYSPQWPEPPDTAAMLTRLVIGTAVVLALCAGSLWLGKPLLQKYQLNTSTSSPLLKIEGSVSLGSRAALYLVRVGDAQVVAGTDATGLKSLVVVPASFREVLDEQLPEETPSVQAPAAPSSPFAVLASSKERP